MKNRKSGFTLMEIMVVIIVIAVLASVAGPMIGSITDQGRASATKSKLSSLKSALLAYQGDIGRFPFKGGNKSYAKNYDDTSLLSWNEEDKNVLVSNTEVSGVTNYGKKWKGPYMDSDVGDFMVDAWGTPIRYLAYNKNLYIWSYGPDLTPATQDPGMNIDAIFKAQSDGNADIDDIVISVSRFKRALSTTGLGKSE